MRQVTAEPCAREMLLRKIAPEGSVSTEIPLGKGFPNLLNHIMWIKKEFNLFIHITLNFIYILNFIYLHFILLKFYLSLSL